MSDITKEWLTHTYSCLHKNTDYLVVELEDNIIDDNCVKLEEGLKVCPPEIHPG
jgi:hypothetical protein